MELTAAELTTLELPVPEVWARWPALSPLLALDDPPYRFTTIRNGLVIGVRQFESYSDTVWFIEARAGGVRRPILNRAGPKIAPEATSGSVPDALDLLLRPARVIEP